jgi:hypothetical protein
LTNIFKHKKNRESLNSLALESLEVEMPSMTDLEEFGGKKDDPLILKNEIDVFQSKFYPYQ